MIRITFLLMLLTPTFLNGESPSWPLGIKNECTKLIREGGQIACNLTGEGDYYSMSITNCWVTCTRGFNMFMLPDPECKRVLESIKEKRKDARLVTVNNTKDYLWNVTWCGVKSTADILWSFHRRDRTYAWDGYQKLFGKLPPYGFEDPHHGPVPCQDAV
uniref:Putative salivary secreted protein n=1 Tax=Ixodes ricinus TaxID=34613 RepID=A0A6B0UXG0_IXORI